MSNNKQYLTKDGLEKARQEYEALRKERKEKLRNEAPEALHSEDVNPEYISFQKDMSVLNKKIAKLEDVIRNVEIIDSHDKDCKEVCLGAEVTVDVGGQEDKLTLVGTMEADPSVGKISNESPVGKALLGKKEGESVTVSSPIKTLYKIKKVTYSKN